MGRLKQLLVHLLGNQPAQMENGKTSLLQDFLKSMELKKAWSVWFSWALAGLFFLVSLCYRDDRFYVGSNFLNPNRFDHGFAPSATANAVEHLALHSGNSAFANACLVCAVLCLAMGSIERLRLEIALQRLP